ncbi:MAG TPA: 16S rRNA (adenine(1518)-N(6)/adenine(1519)-N(6))-dimethyltransferase RsmA [Gemmatimonadales bacterium]|nr:16S rRNA (adenine(1518)-N(6)/adenine(1519)-N(6))-dimethyltransferase RsmA [Gemmatimonadales bacterium]
MRPPRAKRRLGQHFLFDPSILRRIAAATLAGPGDTVLEIGPGPGGLTAELLKLGCRVMAIERDADMLASLRERAPDADIIEGDALELDWHAVAGHPPLERWIVAGNIPYNITTPLIDQALTPPMPSRVVFLVQEEVALRLAARPGTKAYGALSVGVQAAARVERLFAVPPGAFTPPPRVTSAVVRLTPLDVPVVPLERQADFRRFVVDLFSRRRKQLAGSLRQVVGAAPAAIAAVLAAHSIRPDARAETLTPQQLWAVMRGLVDDRDGEC